MCVPKEDGDEWETNFLLYSWKADGMCLEVCCHGNASQRANNGAVSDDHCLNIE